MFLHDSQGQAVYKDMLRGKYISKLHKKYFLKNQIFLKSSPEWWFVQKDVSLRIDHCLRM